MAFRQCPKRLWLQIHQPDDALVSAQSQVNFATGNQVGDIAIKLYDKVGKQQVIDPFRDGWTQAISQTHDYLKDEHPIFEATFTIEGALALADVLKSEFVDGEKHWHMVEVKASTSVKATHIDDTAFQYFVANQSGIKLSGVSLACINNRWVYEQEGNYQGLLEEHDLTEHALALQEDVSTWLAGAHKVANEGQEPIIEMGSQCNSPYACEFQAYCSKGIEEPDFPVRWLPRRSPKLKQYIEQNGLTDMREVPNELLNEKQQLVKECTLDNEYFLDKEGAQEELSQCRYPLYFLDFETINFGVPRWIGTRPYQQIPFQYSLHTLNQNNQITHTEFLDLSGKDPSLEFAKQLVKDCKNQGSILVYNQAFEKKRIEELAVRFPELANALLAINARIVDLLPICQRYYYHPGQHGSWSIKKVLPNMVPELNYEELEGVQHGGAAMDAFVEAIDSTTTDERKQELDRQLRKYCELDTYAMVKIWQFFGRTTNMRSVRKVLAEALKYAAEESTRVTGRTINDLPEYYLGVKSADYLHQYFKSFSFSMEDSIQDLVDEIGVDDERGLLPRQKGKVDLIIRGQKSERVKHLVEFKRGFKKSEHLKDILRQSAFCVYSPAGHKTEKNYMVMVAPVSSESMESRHVEICEFLENEFGKLVKTKVEYVDLSHQLSTRKTRSKDKPLFGAVWELIYSGT